MMMQIVNAGKGGDRRGEKTHDPCVGTGRMMMIASNYSMRLYGQDIDPLCCLITKINLAFYAPWYHIPASFFGNESETDCVENRFAEAKPAAHSPPSDIKHSDESATVTDQTLGERLRRRKESAAVAKGKKTKYTTEIEQPTLF